MTEIVFDWEKDKFCHFYLDGRTIKIIEKNRPDYVSPFYPNLIIIYNCESGAVIWPEDWIWALGCAPSLHDISIILLSVDGYKVSGKIAYAK